MKRAEGWIRAPRGRLRAPNRGSGACATSEIVSEALARSEAPWPPSRGSEKQEPCAREGPRWPVYTGVKGLRAYDLRDLWLGA